MAVSLSTGCAARRLQAASSWPVRTQGNDEQEAYLLQGLQKKEGNVLQNMPASGEAAMRGRGMKPAGSRATGER
jgi:hypothetical protein